MKNYYYLFIVSFIFISCSKEMDFPSQGSLNPLFSSSELISIPPYTYSENTDVYYIRGDSSINPNVVIIGGQEFILQPEDIFSSQPLLQWTATGLKFVAVGIFDEQPSVSNITDSITNPEHMIWTWNTSMEGREGFVEYNNGISVQNGVFQNGLIPTPLSISSQKYYWAVWAWDNNGEEILYSSLVLPFYVAQN